MILTLIKELTASGDSALSFVDGTASVVLDNTYAEYMFVCTDIGPATDNVNFQFQGNVAGGSGYNETITSAAFLAGHDEADSETTLASSAGNDLAQGTGYQNVVANIGNGADESSAGILHIFNPSSTTYNTNFYSRFSMYHEASGTYDQFRAGYFNLTGAIDEISFAMSSGNFDGVIQLYGVA